MGDVLASNGTLIMRLLLFLFPVLMFGQGTDLPGPIAALPDGSANPTGVCSWNGAQTFKTCFLTNSGIGANYTVTAQAANYIAAGINLAQTFTGTQTFSGDIDITNLNDSAGALMLRSSDRSIWNLTKWGTNIFWDTDNTDAIGTPTVRTKEIYSAAGYFPATTSGGGCSITGSAAHMVCTDPSSGTVCTIGGVGVQCQFSIVSMLNVDGVNGNITAENNVTGQHVIDNDLISGAISLVCASTAGQLQITSCPGGGGVSSVTATSPLASSGGTTPNLSCSACAVTSGPNTFVGTQTFAGNLNATVINDSSGALVFRSSDRSIWNINDWGTNIFWDTDNADAIGTASKRTKEIYSAAGYFPATTSGGGCSITGSAAHMVCTDPSSGTVCTIGGVGVQCQLSIVSMLNVDGVNGNITAENNIKGQHVIDNDLISGSTSPVCASTAGQLQITSCPGLVTSATTPITLVSGVVACATCLTTNTSQTVSAGRTTFSSAELLINSSSNFYTSPRAGLVSSCSGVADGWFAVDTSGLNLNICSGGNKYKVALTAY